MNELSNRGRPRPSGLAGHPPSWNAGLALLLDELAYGIVVVGLSGELLHTNRTAQQELARSPNLRIAEGMLQAATPVDRRALREAIARVADGKRSMLTLAVRSGEALTLAVLPLRGGEAGAPVTSAVLLLARASVCESLMLYFFARSHGLTHSEEQVLGILCQGHSAPQVARELHVAVSTVRSHVRNLCAKTSTRGVRQLVNRVAVLPPVVPALRSDQLH